MKHSAWGIMKGSSTVLWPVWISVGVAAACWFAMFSPWTAGCLNFWSAMSVACLLLTTLSLCFCREWVRDLHFRFSEVALGLGMAALFWCFFWVGDKLSSLLFDFARPQVDLIYGLRDGESAWGIGLLLLLLIGPAEEIFWRSFVQRRMMQRWGSNVGFVVTTLIYAAVHLWSFNFMLLMAALVIGALWGLFYRLWPQHLLALIISHAVWDAVVFVVLPI